MAVETIFSAAADARVAATNATFATARGASTGTLQSASTNPTGIGDNFDGASYFLPRFFMPFTSAVSSALVSSATFRFEVDTKSGDTKTVHLVGSSQATPVVADDFNNLDFTSFGSVAVTGTGIFTINLNATGIAYLQARMGTTILLALIGAGDQSNVAPIVNGTTSMYTGDEATQLKPELAITYTLVEIGGAFLYNFV